MKSPILLVATAVVRLAVVLSFGTASAVYASGQDEQPVLAPNPDLPPLPIEDMNIVETLPDKYPETWFLVYDLAFTHMLSGEVIVFDAAETNHVKQWKGSFPLAQVGMYAQSVSRNEIYAIDTYYSRGTRGERVDVVSIYDNKTLSFQGEVILPGNKRLGAFPARYSATLINNEKFLVISNFNPAASVTIVDVDKREIVSDIATPGCTIAYPTGKLGFSSICSSGALLTTTIDKNGKLAKQKLTKPFFDTNTEAISEHTAIIDGTAYFPSFKGLVHPIDLSGEFAKVGESWSLISEEDAKQNWRPGGMLLIDKDDLGRLYVIMHPDGFDGSRQHGGPEVWVFDPKKKERIARYELKTWGLSIAISRGKNPLMMVSNGDLNLDVYNAKSGEYLHTISDKGMLTPLEARGAR